MQVTVSGKQIELSDALRAHVNSQLDVITGRYFETAQEARVLFSHNRGFFTCAINLHPKRELVVRGEGEAQSAQAAFDVASQHIAKQLRRHRRRLSEHARGVGYRMRSEPAMLSVLRFDDEPDADAETTPMVNGHDGQTLGCVVAESPMEMHAMTVNVAVMRMDFEGLGVLMFRNSVTEQINVVYRRPDGHVGWIEHKVGGGETAGQGGSQIARP